jgi:glycosyltransferase involved in cell wall biosynthesis
MPPLSICIITFNEEHNLPRLLHSAQGLAEEIVVVDSGSTDRTAEIARSAGVRFHTRAWTNFGDQKNFAASLASQDWILLLDADEELSEELRQSVQLWKTKVPEFTVYEIARMTWFLGAWIRHSRWYPDWQRRLYDRRKAQFVGTIHESIKFGGPIGRLGGDLLHYTARNLAEQLEKQETYSTLAAQSLYERGVRNWRTARWVAAPWAWVQYFVLGAGFLDGFRGFLIARLAAQTVWLKYTKLGALIQKKEASSP